MYKKENLIFGIIFNFIIIFLYFKTNNIQQLLELKNIIIFVILMYITNLIFIILKIEDKQIIKKIKENKFLFDIFYISSFIFILFVPVLVFIFSLLIIYIKTFLDLKNNVVDKE